MHSTQAIISDPTNAGHGDILAIFRILIINWLNATKLDFYNNLALQK